MKLLRQRHDEIARDEFIGPKATKVTMRELFDAVVADYTARDNRSAHTDEIAKATVNRELAVIRRGYKLATRGKAKLVSPNSVPAIEMYPENNAREGFVEYGDFLELVRHLPTEIADVCWFGYLMGWRRDQVLSLRWNDVNRDAGTVIRRTEHNKTKEPSAPVMSESVRAVIERRWLARTVMTATGPKVCDLVFHREGRRIKDFRKAWQRACIAAGFARPVLDALGQPVLDRNGRQVLKPTLIFHDFRRSCVRNLENAGTPRKVGKSITGHITDSVYERYHIVKEDDQRAALARVEAGFLATSHKSPNFSHNGTNDHGPTPTRETM